VIVKGHPGSRMVRLVVDAEEGVDIERIARLSRQVSAEFDELDPIAGRYTLQVSSPGADRPLITARDFARNVGRPVRIASTAGGEVEGVVTAAGSETVSVEVDGEDVEVRLEDVRDARVQLPW
jgi:ribosome maturation factor RimP